MLLIGLTGGIGMGKSTVAEYLTRKGELLVDTDVLARKLAEPGQPGFEEIKRKFGSGVVDASGKLDRAALGAIVFHSSDARRELEAILHPRIRAAWRQEVERWRNERASRGIIVIPLLYETAAETELDKVICVACSPGVQNARLRGRGWSETEIARRIAAQWPIQKKMDRADGVIWNESSIEICEEQCARLVPGSAGDTKNTK